MAAQSELESSKSSIVTITFDTGNVYNGLVKNKRPHGYGTMKYKNGDSYEGDWVDGVSDGNGKEFVVEDIKDGIVSGHTYTGQFKNNMRNGKGTMIYSDGNKYEGDWHNNDKFGSGKMIYKCGKIYNGIWKFDQTYMTKDVMINGNRYIGQCDENNTPNGLGKMYYANRDYYEGQWFNGQKNGKGVYIWSDKNVYPGIFTFPRTSKYTGQWENDKEHGKGTRTYANLDTYIGDWINGFQHGHGQYKWGIETNCGDEFYGQFENGKKNGHGTYIPMKHWGEQYTGHWINDINVQKNEKN